MSERAGEQAGGPPDPVSRWEEQEREELADCRVFSVQRRRFRHPRRGVEADFFVVQPADWAVAMGRTAEGAWLMVRQFRYGTQSRGWEFPSGCCGPGEDPLAAATRELREETGYEGRDPVVLGTVEPNPAIQDNRCTFVYFRHLAHAGVPAWDEHEEIEVALWTDAELRAAARDGRMPHALMHAGLSLHDAWAREA